MDGNGDAILWLPFEGRLFCPIFQVQTFPVSLPEAKKFYIQNWPFVEPEIGVLPALEKEKSGGPAVSFGKVQPLVLWVQPHTTDFPQMVG